MTSKFSGAACDLQQHHCLIISGKLTLDMHKELHTALLPKELFKQML